MCQESLFAAPYWKTKTRPKLKQEKLRILRHCNLNLHQTLFFAVHVDQPAPGDVFLISKEEANFVFYLNLTDYNTKSVSQVTFPSYLGSFFPHLLTI